MAQNFFRSTWRCFNRTSQSACKLHSCWHAAVHCESSLHYSESYRRVSLRPMRIISLLPAATEIAGALGLTEQVVGVSHECDFPEQANERPRVTHCPVHNAKMASCEVNEWVRRALHDNGSIYTIDEQLLRKLQPDVILTQKLCDVCAVGYTTVAKLAQTLPGPTRVVNLEPTSLADIFGDIRRVADACEARERAEKLIVNLSERVENVRERAERIP